MKKNKKAFSMAELVATLVIIGFISTIITSVYSVNAKETAKVKFKNSIVTFKMALEKLMTDPIYYSINSDLSDTSIVTLDNHTFGGENKFREIIMYEMGISTVGYVPCEILQGDNIVRSNNCFVQDNGVVWGIPNTNFEDINLKRTKNAQGTVSDYLPITIYSNTDKIYKATGYFQDDAIILGVRKDGAMTTITTVNCDKESNKELNQCNIADFFVSNKFGK